MLAEGSDLRSASRPLRRKNSLPGRMRLNVRWLQATMSGKRTKVFIVDDHPIFRFGLQGVISADPGFEVVGGAGDGKAALDGIRAGRADIAVLDIYIPGMNGL